MLEYEHWRQCLFGEGGLLYTHFLRLTILSVDDVQANF